RRPTRPTYPGIRPPLTRMDWRTTDSLLLRLHRLCKACDADACQGLAMLPYTIPQQKREAADVQERLADVFFYLPPEMPDAENGDDVDQPMQLRPTSPQAALRLGGGCDGQRNQQQQSQHADGDVRAFDDVLPQRAELAALIQQ